MSAITVALVAVLIVSQLMTAAQIKSSNQATDRRTDLALDAALAKGAVRGMRIAATYIRQASDIKSLETQFDDYKKAYAEFIEKVDHIASTTTIPARIEQTKQMKANSAIYAKVVGDLQAGRREIIAIQDKAKGGAMSDADKARIAALEDSASKGAVLAIPAAQSIIKMTDEIVAATTKAANESKAAADQAVSFANLVTIILGIVAITVMILAALLGTMMIARPLRALITPLESVAGGNFAISVPGSERRDEVGQIAAAVQSMAQRVSATIAEIKASGREVTNASAEI
ncbi:MAG: HAMP domain-containing protein, partial [Proteobacteria bacterium]|nr:HAMP domain-containing protein [Pseudomonadota bacterium]